MADNPTELKYRWEWYDNIESKWKVYSDEVQDALNNSLKNKKTNVKCLSNHLILTKYHVDFLNFH